jgi:hypothetical protein
MTIAEVHGKLTPYEGMEDLLTSDVFGTFRYLEPNQGLIPFLKRAQRFREDEKPCFLSDVASVEYFFWQRSIELKREPDLVLLITNSDGSEICILVEAKYRSRKSNRFIDEDMPDDENKFDGDQLAEYYLELKKGNFSFIRQRNNVKRSAFLFYVTAHDVKPVKDIEESLNKITNDDSKNFYWLNWQEIISVVEEIESNGATKMQHLMLNDLVNLLEYKSLTYYAGYSKIPADLHYSNRYFWEGEL